MPYFYTLNKKVILSLFVYTFFLIPFSAATLFAQTTLPPNPATITPVAVAEVNIQGIKIDDQVQNIFTLSFSLTNGKGMQNDVRYDARLMKQTSTGYVLVDEKIYDETLTLAENSSILKSITYTAPSMLSGSYALFVVVENQQGFPLGIASVGTVTLATLVPGIEILSETCHVGDISHALGSTFSLAPSSELILTCSVFNQTKGDLTVTPVFTTYADSSFGTILTDVQGGVVTPLQIKAGKKESVTFTFPHALNPNVYSSKLSLSYGQNPVTLQSNSVVLSYRIVGKSGTILNATLDHDFYTEDSTAIVSILWNASEVENATADVRITNNKNDLCATVQDYPLTSGKTDVQLLISRNCFNPTAEISLRSQDNTLDTKTIALSTTSVSEPVEKKPLSFMVILLITGAVIGIIGLGLSLRRKRAAVLLPALFIGVGISLIPCAQTHATTYIAGQNNDVFVTVNIDKPIPQTYTPSQNIVVTGSVSVSNAAPSSYDISLGAVTIGNSSVNLYNSASITLAPGASSVGIPRTLIAPSAPGTYIMAFSADVVLPPTVALAGDSNIDYSYNCYDASGVGSMILCNTQIKYFGGQICLNRIATSDISVRIKYPPYDGNNTNPPHSLYQDFPIYSGETCAPNSRINNNGGNNLTTYRFDNAPMNYDGDTGARNYVYPNVCLTVNGINATAATGSGC